LPFDERPFGHQFAFGVIGLFLRSVMYAATSLRGSSAVLEIFQGLLPGLPRTPSPNGGQMWLLRIGLYEITRPKEKANDWVWLVDHTLQIGQVKCLLVVGCRGQAWQSQPRPLEHQDLQVLALEPMLKSTGEKVCKHLEQLVAVTGRPRQIVSDQGSDLKNGITEFCQRHQGTAYVHDITHQAALILKRELTADERWASFLSAMGRCKPKLLQTALAHLTPPSPKVKARYMNLEELVRWGQKTLAYVDGADKIETPAVPQQEFEDKLGWLRSYREALTEWSGVMEVVSTTLTYVRKNGYHANAERELAEAQPPVAAASMPSRVATALRQFVATEATKAGPGERLIGSSECLESLIGKGKRLEGQQSKGGFTKMVLAMAAAVVEPTKEYLESAFASIQVKDISSWCRTKLGDSLQALRRQAFAANTAGTKLG
jgi:hypothetical protein